MRTQQEWDAGHLPFAHHIPLDDLNTRLSDIDPERLTVFVCRTGNRSGAAAEALAPMGYAVANLTGGMRACAKASLPVVADDGSNGVVL